MPNHGFRGGNIHFYKSTPSRVVYAPTCLEKARQIKYTIQCLDGICWTRKQKTILVTTLYEEGGITL